MEQDNSSQMGANAIPLCGKSWVAYLGLLALALILFGALLPLAFMWNELAAGVVLVLSAIIVIFRFLSIRSVQLYYDDVGVWLFSGILPWKKGVTGVKWRDMDEATFVQGFFSWIFKSYSVRIGHRFTKSSEIFLTDMARGKDVVAALNARQQELIRNNVIH